MPGALTYVAVDATFMSLIFSAFADLFAFVIPNTVSLSFCVSRFFLLI